MLKTIFWSDLVRATLMVAGLYYVVVVLIFYRAEIGALINGKKGSAVAGEEDGLEPGDDPEEGPADLVLTLRVIAELRILIKKVLDDGVEKEDLIRTIAQTLKPHAHLKGTAYGVSVNNFVVHECASIYAVHLTENEVGLLWE